MHYSGAVNKHELSIEIAIISSVIVSSLDNRGKVWIDWDVVPIEMSRSLTKQQILNFKRAVETSQFEAGRKEILSQIFLFWSLLNFYFHSPQQRMLIDRTFGMPKWWSTKFTFIFWVTWVDYIRDERNTHARPDRIFDTTTSQYNVEFMPAAERFQCWCRSTAPLNYFSSNCLLWLARDVGWY